MLRFLLASNSGSWSTWQPPATCSFRLCSFRFGTCSKLDWKQLKINQRDKHIRDLRDATPARAADLERLERSICRLSLQMEHMQLVIKNPEWSFHTFAMPEKTASSAHTIFVRPPSGNRIEVTIPPGKQPDELFTVMLEDAE
ncbi:hypothetical protein EMIHUDRAFT_206783 [Emiliania huxleyi CCMP1516]|uniref:E2F transcription factor CC-MB domain-containing protein n=2 Tax=Emiliania huxleyi TaxID=2903 RepID=A0A0D3JMG1_EMIH1|nr:hypothetical protein EMIHUDRAFT_206783 [Emiliania huxleyi CCMP1516]EOD24696.1 hypothetical protein EMIHUDRAFT_206783 [Emiliania huxleyi CCMP1516]|eukprot:XP_005777125.1 hypothetical protein EMIHUDRAFT_206783 [Emiliania huxleyi CCMP1516]